MAKHRNPKQPTWTTGTQRPSPGAPLQNPDRASTSADGRAALLNTRHGLVLNISVVPNAKKTEFSGRHAGRLRVRLAAPPVDGLANAALQRWLAEQLHLAVSAISVLRGATGRHKQVLIVAEPAEVERWLNSLPLSA